MLLKWSVNLRQISTDQMHGYLFLIIMFVCEVSSIFERQLIAGKQAIV